MTSTISDVEKYLGEARDLEVYWREYGWETLNIDEIEEVEILDIYPIVEANINVTITIKLPNKIYVVPLEDVSPLNVNNCLTIEVSSLYPDWEKRIETNLGEPLIDNILLREGDTWYDVKYIGEDEKIRIVKRRVSSIS
jgi:hypothetical protein